MCELLGLAFNQPVNPSLSFRGFRHRGEQMRHGWGLAYYSDHKLQVLKEPHRADESPLLQLIIKKRQIRSQIFIAHVRYSTGTAITYENTHPFYRCAFGNEFVFAHNGCVNTGTLTLSGRFVPIGETDSEHVFCYLMDAIYDRGITRWTSDDFVWMHKILRGINSCGGINCLFSDGEHLFCYHDLHDHTSLYYLLRHAPYRGLTLKDEDLEVDLSEEKDAAQMGYIFATKPLTDERWRRFDTGQLIVFKAGAMLYMSSP